MDRDSQSDFFLFPLSLPCMSVSPLCKVKVVCLSVSEHGSRTGDVQLKLSAV